MEEAPNAPPVTGRDRAALSGLVSDLATTDVLLRELAATTSRQALADLMEAVTRELGFRHYALIHHDDLRGDPAGRVNIKHYPPSASERIIDQCMWRRDPVLRACAFADTAFLWSALPRLIRMDRRDRQALALGFGEGLNEGITVPSVVLGQCMGSCTFAGTTQPERAERVLGIAQMVGVFAFQAAKRIVGQQRSMGKPPRLHPRPRDCVVLAGRGQTNKEIARALALAPRTVDGYLAEARQLFHAHDRTELVVDAVLTGEVGLHELMRRQPG